MLEPWAAIILAGGHGAGLGGVDKAGIEISGRTLLSWVLDAVVDAREVVVVGDPVPTDRPVTFTRESPRFGGPSAALLTGLDALLRPTAYVAAVAVDMPMLTPATLRRLLDAAGGRANGQTDGAQAGEAGDRAGDSPGGSGGAGRGDGAVLVDPEGRRQLCYLLSTTRLGRVRPDLEGQHNLSLRRLLAPLELVEVPSIDHEHRDVDTWSDLRDLAP